MLLSDVTTGRKVSLNPVGLEFMLFSNENGDNSHLAMSVKYLPSTYWDSSGIQKSLTVIYKLFRCGRAKSSFSILSSSILLFLSSFQLAQPKSDYDNIH